MITKTEEYSLIADVALIAEGKVLLVKYTDTNKYDHQSGWFLPDAGIGYLEHPERAALRIAKEQLGLDLPNSPSTCLQEEGAGGWTFRLGLLESFKGNDGSWHLPFHYVAELGRMPDINPSADIAEARWFELDNLPPKGEVAHHGWALSVLRRLDEGRI